MTTAVLPIRLYGDDILRQRAVEVDNIDGALADFLDLLVMSMKQAKGLGLAANQLGIGRRVFAIDMSYFDVVRSPLVVINPQIVEVSESLVKAEEGCLSFPGLYLELTRPHRAVIKGLDRHGKEIVLEGSDLVARVLLHEIDHLDGRLFIDHLSSSERGLIQGKLKKIKAGQKL